MRCDRLLLMREGRILTDTTPAELLASTGAKDPESAFLAVISKEEAGASGRGSRHSAGEGSPDPSAHAGPDGPHGRHADGYGVQR